MSQEDKKESYVWRVTEDTMAYVKELQAETLSLRDRVALYETSNHQLQEALEKLRQESGRRSEAVIQKFQSIEQQNSDLANLYVASYRLHETLDRQEVLAIIQEILANLVGSEEVGIYEMSPDRERLALIWSVGIDAERLRTLSASAGRIGAAVGSKNIWVAGNGSAAVEPLGHETHLTACIPLLLSGQVTGVIAVFRLLVQKSSLTSMDHELFAMLATHAATAIYSSGLHARAGEAENRGTA